ncbi:MAG TPA: ParB/RepB/Spo0J family partition protein [Verrucomicrobiales bacterium]|nr:ParB/RepB/Spo0J family partition protein [Verrucomicrobiales bacterium]
MAKTGLGRGLSALLGTKKETPASATAATVAPVAEGERVLRLHWKKVKPCPLQPRKEFDRAALEGLAESIKTNGIIQPLVVRQVGDEYELIAGERRWRATQIAGLDTVPVVVREASDAEVLEMALVENLQREDLNPIEEAQGYGLLIDAFQLTQEEAARRVGKSRAAVANALRLLKLDEDVQTHVRQGRLATGHAKVILGLDDAAQQKLAADRVIRDQLSVRDTEALVSSLQNGTSPKAKKTGGAKADVHITDLENRIKQTLGTQVSLRHRNGKGAITIKYFSEDDLERILGLLGVEAK